MCNPHGIDSILNKPAAQLGSISPALSSKFKLQNDDGVISRIKSEGNMLSQIDASNGSEDSHKQHSNAQCWPEFQNVLANQSLWRDRSYLGGKKAKKKKKTILDVNKYTRVQFYENKNFRSTAKEWI